MRLKSDPEWVEIQNRRSREWRKRKYAEDKMFREKKKERSRNSHRRKYKELAGILIERQGGRCTICGDDLPDDPSQIHFDHVIPRAMGGSDSLKNLSAVHASCNFSKSDKLLPIQLTLHRTGFGEIDDD